MPPSPHSAALPAILGSLAVLLCLLPPTLAWASALSPPPSFCTLLALSDPRHRMNELLDLFEAQNKSVKVCIRGSSRSAWVSLLLSVGCGLIKVAVVNVEASREL